MIFDGFTQSDIRKALSINPLEREYRLKPGDVFVHRNCGVCTVFRIEEEVAITHWAGVELKDGQRKYALGTEEELRTL